MLKFFILFLLILCGVYFLGKLYHRGFPQSASTQRQPLPLFTNPTVSGILFILLGSFFLAISLYGLNKEWRANTHFLATTCKIVDEKLQRSTMKSSITYTPLFYLQYQVAGQSYQVWHAASILQSGSSFMSNEHAQLNHYQRDQVYPCWYDPDMPTTVVLEQGYSWMGMLFGIFSVFIVALGIVMCLASRKRDST
jgi:hypothetical protein